MRREELYQWSLIFLLVVTTILFGVFVYREVFPEYKIYQNAYVALEEFRSKLTGEPQAPSSKGVKQIVMPRDDKGPAKIDRCVSCHVATKLSHFSPTKLSYDINGNLVVDAKGQPVLTDNENYIWRQIDDSVAGLTDPAVVAQLEAEGDAGAITAHEKEAKRLAAMKVAHVGHHEYDMTKVLRMHPLLARETRPFEYHPIEEYGCTSCHNGNGRSLVTDKAHGPIFDGQYHAAETGPVPQFTEPDPKNDPAFSKVFNHKPGHELLFQTTPLFVGHLMEARCAQCHQSAASTLGEAARDFNAATEHKERQVEAMEQGVADELSALVVLVKTKRRLQSQGYANSVKAAGEELKNPHLQPAEQSEAEGRLRFLERAAAQGTGDDEAAANLAIEAIDRELAKILGSPQLVQQLESRIENGDAASAVQAFLVEHHDDSDAIGSVFTKMRAIEAHRTLEPRIRAVEEGLQAAAQDQQIATGIAAEIDMATRGYQRGQELFRSQACYACHRIAGFSRGGVGPELTRIGEYYPWYVKESIVWPQGNLATSTMPNFKLDHEELEVLMAFLMAQRADNRAISEVEYKSKIKAWEAGQKLPWEKPVQPSRLRDVRGTMKIFATEGCASCHRLKGFESDVGFTVEEGGATFDQRWADSRWFHKVFPEEMIGSELVAAIETNGDAIDRRIARGVRQGGILEEIERENPQLIESYYTNFKYALRAKAYLLHEAPTLAERERVSAEVDAWQERVRRVLKVYVQQYGLGRLIAPRPNWAGVFRSDQWLIEHFRKPTAHVPKSIMPVLPFDSTKFYALTHMLGVIGKHNRDAVREIWEERGFSPELAYEMLCSNCHGEYLRGNGPTAEWIYPIPKDLRNATFLRNLTKERVMESVLHGVKGTPMPPWGEIAEDKQAAGEQPVLTEGEVAQLVDWLLLSLPGARVIRSATDVLKWQYSPEDVLKELEEEGEKLEPQAAEGSELSAATATLRSLLPSGEGLWAALEPQIEVSASDEGLSVEEVFDVAPSRWGGPEQKEYYIKKKYYTEKNLIAGEQLFIANCSVCHGKEGGGNGERAGTMDSAKPRMLTNLDWLQTRDDLRLLRSIKYGVAGTSMTPWGDYTNTLQRMRLVMFIRQLSRPQLLREDLSSELFQAFENMVIALSDAWAGAFVGYDELRQQLADVRNRRQALYDEVQAGAADANQAVTAYQQELQLANRIKSFESADILLAQLITNVEQEKSLYQSLGLPIVEGRDGAESVGALFALLKANKGRFVYSGGNLVMQLSEATERNLNEKSQQLVDHFEQRVHASERERDRLHGMLPSAERSDGLDRVAEQLQNINKIKKTALMVMEGAARLRQQQRTLYEQYRQQLGSGAA